ncbi:U4/U5/U6 small nuclear ribonucleoprotein prp3 [Taxawa tesnikishii (nom. ined.)]|nr:U4/U5/U6 small nuclear ribonucleoprotein prp3 [Dothideales sp. JES 119]
MPEKRPYPADGVENGDNKRSRSINGSPAPPPSANGAETDIERKRREAEQRIAELKAKMAAKRGAAPTPPAPAAQNNAMDAKARIEAMKAKLNLGKSAAAAPAPPAAASPSPAPASPAPEPTGVIRDPALQARLAALREKFSKPREPAAAVPTPPPVREDASRVARGGLGVGLHPSLMGDLSAPAARGKGPQRGGREAEKAAKANPYLSTDTADEQARNDPYYDAGLQRQKNRVPRALLINQKGKYINQANAIRQQERIEAMKREIQEQARKQAIEQATEKSFLVAAPPDIEWWDEGLVNGKDYNDLDAPGKLNFDVITQYVQHPVLLDPPQDKNMPAPKPLPLTKTEQAKLRRQRRMADHKEEQAKIRLGLKPPPPPKVKKSNLMRVLGQEAVKDPTAVEARVNREIAQRAADHEAANEERKLTKEQRNEKLAAQQEADAAKGMKISVYKIDNLSNGKHRYKVQVNATQNALTGCFIINPKMNLVIVEGGAHSINFYRKLMLNRIKWDENAPPTEGGKAPEAEWLNPMDERGQLKDLSSNKCTLVWEGEEKDRAFKRLGTRVCETDGEAKDFLSRYKMENMWTLAQSME